MNREKIGIGIITCNRESYFVDCFKSIDQSKINELVIVNDGQEFTKSTKELVNNSSACYLHNNVNLGVSKTKNKALKYLLKKNCEHIFILEDDCFIKNNNIWKLYIDAYKETHIPHFNYGPASPWNREQQDSSIIGNLSKRHLAVQHSKPTPKLIIKYNSNTTIALYQHIVAMFTYFHHTVLEEVGLLDENFYNAWEHVEHTYRIIKAGKYTPFWWFADVYGSENYIQEAVNEKANTSLAKNEKEFMDNTLKGLQYFYELHNIVPSMIQPETKEAVITRLQQIQKKL